MVSNSANDCPRLLRDIRCLSQEWVQLRGLISLDVLCWRHSDLFNHRGWSKPLMKPEILNRQHGRKMLIRYNGMTKTVAEWAAYFNVSKGRFQNWLSRHGVEYAFKRGHQTEAERQDKTQDRRHGDWTTPLPRHDKDLEAKNRLHHWSNRFTPDEIAVKAKMMRLA